MTQESNLDQRLPLIRIRDVILAALQSAFADENLVPGGNPFLFVRNDVKASKVWICTPEGAHKYERDNRRGLVTVERGDYIPSEMHLHNISGMSFSGGQSDFSDLASTNILIRCQHGSETMSEVVASACYTILKTFRIQLMQEFDIHSLHIIGITAPVYQPETPGEPWECIINMRVQMQEFSRMTEVANHLNHLEIREALESLSPERVIASLDGSPD